MIRALVVYHPDDCVEGIRLAQTYNLDAYASRYWNRDDVTVCMNPGVLQAYEALIEQARARLLQG